MSYRDDVTALAARHDALAAEVAAKVRELEESRKLLDQARGGARLPVLDQVQVASRCTADWEQMTGDRRVRNCGDCRKDVYNLSGMTREEAEALIRERNGELCMRYYQRHDGTILVADCTVEAERLQRMRGPSIPALGILLAALITGCMITGVVGLCTVGEYRWSRHERPRQVWAPDISVLMGKPHEQAEVKRLFGPEPPALEAPRAQRELEHQHKRLQATDPDQPPTGSMPSLTFDARLPADLAPRRHRWMPSRLHTWRAARGAELAAAGQHR